MPRRILLLLSVFSVLLIAANSARPDEGMYPLSRIQKLNLRSKGLHVTPADIYRPGKIGLIDAIVQIGGCTGSFVSPDGLIITNHHCAFGIVQEASSAGHDYIANGFLAPTRMEELPARGYTVRITESYRDVSNEILSGLSDTMDVGDRAKAISKKIKEIVAAAEKDNTGKRAEVAEMFAGKSYTLFLYTFLKDVRAVYVPPRSIGEFGGEDDNWVWPRHTGDFSFLRAYVAPDGSPADYSPANVPYHPRKFLKINPKGVDEEDAVFMLGYPGRTYRHRTSQYLSFEEEVRMPYIADLFEWQIATMQGMGKNNRDVAIKHDGRIKSLANTMKNYRGKLKGMQRLHLVAQKQEEERGLQSFIDADPARKQRYGTLLTDIGQIYQAMRERALYELTLDYLQTSNLLSFANTIYQASRERQKPDLDRESAFMDRNYSRTKENIALTLHNYYEPTDRIFLKEMLLRSTKLPAGQRIAVLDSLTKGDTTGRTIDALIEQLYRTSKLNDSSSVMQALSLPPTGVDSLNDPFIKLIGALWPSYQALKNERTRRESALGKYYALLVDVKMQYQKTDFIPDANSTLRLTFGRIRGFSPADALYASPITSLRGVIEKTTDSEPYNTPAKIVDLYNKKAYGKYKAKKLNDVPVALLYNLDTTGGNSGSPLLDANGDIVGVNFDRAYEATINDYAWSEKYSRSIAVDIRYVLWVLDKFAGAENVLNELGI